MFVVISIKFAEVFSFTARHLQGKLDFEGSHLRSVHGLLTLDLKSKDISPEMKPVLQTRTMVTCGANLHLCCQELVQCRQEARRSNPSSVAS